MFVDGRQIDIKNTVRCDMFVGDLMVTDVIFFVHERARKNTKIDSWNQSFYQNHYVHIIHQTRNGSNMNSISDKQQRADHEAVEHESYFLIITRTSRNQ